MAFPPMAHLHFFGRASRLRTAGAEMLRCRCGERQAQGDAGQVRTMRCSERADWFRTARLQIAALGSFDRHWLHRSGIMAQTPPG